MKTIGAIEAIKSTLTVRSKAELPAGDYAVHARAEHYEIRDERAYPTSIVTVPREPAILFAFLCGLVGRRAALRGVQAMIDVWGPTANVDGHELPEYMPALPVV